MSLRPTRRQLLAGAASSLAAPAILPASAQGRQLLVYAWYPIPVQSMMKDFAAEFGADVRFIGSYGGNPVWWSKLVAGEIWDVFLPSMDWMTRAALAEKLEPLDLKRIPNLKNLSPVGMEALEKELTVKGKVYALPWALTVNSLAYNTKLVDPAKANADWGVMWDPAFAGRLSTKDEAIIPVLTAAARLGYETVDLSKWSPAQYDAIRVSLL